MELDLHGYSLNQALDIFVETYNVLIDSQSHEPLKVVHGYGSTGVGGVIRKCVTNLLEAHHESLEYAFGEDIDGNPGYTIVYPGERLLSPIEKLYSLILEYCTRLKTREKVVWKFTQYQQYRESDVVQALNYLMRQGKLEIVRKERYKKFKTVQSN